MKHERLEAGVGSRERPGWESRVGVMFWDDLVRRWRRDYKVVSPRLLRGVGGHVAVLPAPRRQRQTRLLLLLVTLIVLGAALLASSGRISAPSHTQATPPSTVVSTMVDV